MGDRSQICDGTMVLRILDDKLREQIQGKMTMVEETAISAAQQADSNNDSSAGGGAAGSNAYRNNSNSINSIHHASKSLNETKLLDLDGVTVEPAIQRSNHHRNNSSTASSSTKKKDNDDPSIWKLHCDGKTYPARLKNLPLPVELHKTRNHKNYYKSSNVSQILIVYSNKSAMKEMETKDAERLSKKGKEEHPSYYAHGLTPPMAHVVEERFAKREHRTIPPTRSGKGRESAKEVREVEKELIKIIETVAAKDGPGGPGSSSSKKKSAAAKSTMNKVLEESEDEVVQYEPWMDNYGQGKGVEFSELSDLCIQHPEVWLSSKEREALIEEEENALREKEKKEEKKKKKKKKKAADQQPVAVAAPDPAIEHPPPVDNEMNIDDMDDIEQQLEDGLGEFGFDFGDDALF